MALLPTYRPVVSGSLKTHWLSLAGKHLSLPGTFLETVLSGQSRGTWLGSEELQSSPGRRVSSHEVRRNHKWNQLPCRLLVSVYLEWMEERAWCLLW